MGKRKSAKKPVAKRGKDPLSTSFKCLFCHHEKSVSVKMDKQGMFGHLVCKICGQKFTTPINNLSVAVDVYCDWVDACEEVRLKQPKKQRPVPLPRAPSPLPGSVVAGASSSDAEGEVDEVYHRASAKGAKRKSVRDAYDDEEEDEEEEDRARKSARTRHYDDDEDDDVDE